MVTVGDTRAVDETRDLLIPAINRHLLLLPSLFKILSEWYDER
jgi:hypothetical protein